MRDTPERKTYDIEQVSRLLGIGRNQAYEAVKRGDIPTIKIGKRFLVPKTALDRLLEAAVRPLECAPIAGAGRPSARRGAPVSGPGPAAKQRHREGRHE